MASLLPWRPGCRLGGSVLTPAVQESREHSAAWPGPSATGGWPNGSSQALKFPVAAVKSTPSDGLQGQKFVPTQF